MRAKPGLFLSFLLLVFVLGTSVGCNKMQRSDAQVASDVQSRISADSTITSKTVAVQAASGVVTLSGSVASDGERASAANDAAAIAGVKTVINNLQVGGSDNASVQQAPAAAAPTPAPAAPEPQPQSPTPTPVQTAVQTASKQKPTARGHHKAEAMSDNAIQQGSSLLQRLPPRRMPGPATASGARTRASTEHSTSAPAATRKGHDSYRHVALRPPAGWA